MENKANILKGKGIGNIPTTNLCKPKILRYFPIAAQSLFKKDGIYKVVNAIYSQPKRAYGNVYGTKSGVN